MNFTFIRYSPAILIVASLLWSRDVHAQAEKAYVDPAKSNKELLAACQDHYYPALENRVLSDIPLQIMWMKVGDNDFSLTPVAGLDVYGIWISPVHMNCHLGLPGKAIPDRTGHQLHVVLNANVSVAAPGTQKKVNLAVPDPGNPGTLIAEETEVTEKSVGGMASVTLGVYWDWRYAGGGHYNRVQIGALLRPGYYFGSGDVNGFALSAGIGIVISPRDD